MHFLWIFLGFLLQVFLETYLKLNPTLHPAMVRLFKTWKPYFPSGLLNKIDVSLRGIQGSTCSRDLRHSGCQSSCIISDTHISTKKTEADQCKNSAAVSLNLETSSFVMTCTIYP